MKRPRVLTISLLLNLVLLALIARRESFRPPGAAGNGENPAAILPASQNEDVVSETVARPSEPISPSRQFRWSQIESSDYREYVSNLRAIGCPESTIREIITADLRSTFSVQRRQLEDQAARLNGRNSPEERVRIEQEKQKLWQEEASWATRLLKPQRPSGSEEVPASDQYARSRPTAGPEGRPVSPRTIPLVFEGVDFSALNLTEREQETIERLRNNFLNQSAQQDELRPSMNSGRVADEQLRGAVGWQRFNQLQFAVAQQKHAAVTE